MKNKLLQNNYFLIGVLAILKLVIHLFTNTNYDLHRDSFLYYSLGQHLDWGYVSVPPFIGFISWLSSGLFNHSAFGLNFLSSLAGALSVVIIAMIVKEFGGGRMAIIIAAIVYIVSPSYLRTNTLFQPVAFDQFFWLLSSYFMVKLIKYEDPKYWIHLGIVWSVGFLNKYLIACYVLCFIISLIFLKLRKLFLNWYFVFGSVAALIIVLPNLIWQYHYNWPVFHHLGELYHFQLVNVSPLNFIIDQFIMNVQGIIVWLTGLICFLILKAERKYITLSITSILVILFLLYMQGKSYYTLGIYPLLIAAGAFCIEKYWKRWAQVAVIVFAIAISLPGLPISLPILNFSGVEKYTLNMAQATNRWEDGQIHNIPQDYADMTGWKELASIVTETYNSLSSVEKQNCAIYAENYGQAGAIKFYSRSYNLPEPISFNDNFLLWAPDSITKENLIYINDEIGDIKYLFNSYILKGEINDKYFRESGVKVYYCTQPIDSFKIFYKMKVARLKSVYIK